MSLTFEQFKTLRQKGLSPEQIVAFEAGEKPDIQPTKKETSKFADFAYGAGKGIISTFRGATALGERGLRSTVGRLFGDTAEDIQAPTAVEKFIPEGLVTPETTAEKIGFGAEQIAEFLLPGAASTKLAKLIPGAGKLASAGRLGTRALAEAGIVGGQRALQKGEIDDDVKTTALVASAFPFIGAGLKKLQAGLKPIGEKIQQSVIRPTARDLKDGFQIANVSKHNLGGSLGETLAKSEQKMNSLAKELESALKGAGVDINVNKVLQETVDALTKKGKAKQFGDIQSINRVIKSLRNEVREVGGERGIVDLLEATNIKRGAGKKGAWVFGSPEKDASATEKVYTMFYNKIKTAIEKASPKDVANINKQISEIIPISNAVIRRIPVEQRNNIISLTDSIGLFGAMFDPRALALIGANKLSKSGKFGQFLINTAQSASKTPLGQRFFGR